MAAVAVRNAFPQEEECVQAAYARSVAALWGAEQDHCGSALSDCSAVLLENGSAPAGVPAGLWADGWALAYSAQADLVVLLENDSIPAGSVPHDWAQNGCSVVPSADGWAQADC